MNFWVMWVMQAEYQANSGKIGMKISSAQGGDKAALPVECGHKRNNAAMRCYERHRDV